MTAVRERTWGNPGTGKGTETKPKLRLAVKALLDFFSTSSMVPFF